jgi:hypothetical protein
MLKQTIKKLIATTVIALSCLTICGCTPAEEQEALTQMQTALSNLEHNRSLAEQFVRDIKASADPSDPGYIQAIQSYQEAREAYDHYLDGVETNGKALTKRSLQIYGPNEVRNATADFLADATAVLKPNVNTRRIPFQRAIVVPDDLQSNLQKVPKKMRERMIDGFDNQVRWRTWEQL